MRSPSFCLSFFLFCSTLKMISLEGETIETGEKQGMTKKTEKFVSEKLRVNQKEMARPFKKISNFVFERKKKITIMF